jgi:hypothetical protein
MNHKSKTATGSAQDKALEAIRAAIRQGDFEHIFGKGFGGTESVSDLAYDAELQTEADALADFLEELDTLSTCERIPKDLRKKLTAPRGISGYTLANMASLKMFNLVVGFFLSLKPTITLDLAAGPKAVIKESRRPEPKRPGETSDQAGEQPEETSYEDRIIPMRLPVLHKVLEISHSLDACLEAIYEASSMESSTIVEMLTPAVDQLKELVEKDFPG